MRAPTPFVLASLVLLAALPAQRNRGEGGQRPELKLQHFTVENGTLPSKKVRDGEAGYTILLPKGHADEANKDKQWPWVLWLSGFGGSNEFQSGGGATVLDALRGEGKVPELAFVIYRAPSTGRRGGRSTYMNGEAAADTEDLLVEDLPAHLAEKYRLSKDRKQRALMGVSMGGFGALKLALRHPDVFGVVAAHSAAVLPADPAELGGMAESQVNRFLATGLDKVLGNPIDKDKWAAHMPLAIVAKKKPDELQGLQIYFDAGTADRYGFCEPNEELDKAMTAAGHKHVFRKVEGGGHAFGSESMQDNVAHALRFIGLAFAGKDAVAEMAPKAETKSADGYKPGGDGKGGDAGGGK
jgi:S-formylglutathione hydrolase FrmB